MLQLAEVFKLEFLCDPLFQSAKVGQSRCALEISDTLLKIALQVSYAKKSPRENNSEMKFNTTGNNVYGLKCENLNKHGYSRCCKTIAIGKKTDLYQKQCSCKQLITIKFKECGKYSQVSSKIK